MGPIPKDWNKFRESDFKNDNYMNDEQYFALKEGGFTGVIALMERTAEDAELGLTLSDKYGLDYYVRDEINWDVSWDTTVFERNAEFYRNCQKHKSFKGVFITDEPACETYPEIRALKDAFDKFFGKFPFGYYVNLLPTYANDVTQLGAPYPEYIDKYIKEVGNDHVCFDHYPFTNRTVNGKKEDYMYADYLYNLDVVAKACDKANVEMWTFIQAKNYCDNVHDIDYGALSYQIYVSLAFGSKAILYYTYWTWPGYYANEVDTADETGRVAIISSKGKKTEKYYYAKDIHNEINAFSDIITDCKHLRTYMYAKNKAEIQFKDIEIADDSQFTGSAPIIVGEFLTPNGKKAYLVVNATNPYDGIVNTVRCDIKDVRVYNENRVDCKYLPFDLEMKSGKGFFVVEM